MLEGRSYTPDNANDSVHEAITRVAKPFRDMQRNAEQSGNNRVVQVLDFLADEAIKLEASAQNSKYNSTLVYDYLKGDEVFHIRFCDLNFAHPEDTQARKDIGTAHIVRAANAVVDVLAGSSPLWITNTDELHEHPISRRPSRDIVKMKQRRELGLKDIHDMLLPGEPVEITPKGDPIRKSEAPTTLGVTVVYWEDLKGRCKYVGVKKTPPVQLTVVK